MPTTSFTIRTEADLLAAILAVDAGTAGLQYTISFATDLAGPLILNTALTAIDASHVSKLSINGNGKVLDGAGAFGGFQVTAGTVQISGLTTQNAVAAGGAGAGGTSGGGGGGAGLGGGLYVGGTAVVTLIDDSFTADRAVGGAGGSAAGTGLGAGGVSNAPGSTAAQTGVAGGFGGAVGPAPVTARRLGRAGSAAAAAAAAAVVPRAVSGRGPAAFRAAAAAWGRGPTCSCSRAGA